MMDSSNSLLSQKLESVFGPADGPVKFAEAWCEVVSARCDIATLQHIDSAAFSFKSDPPLKVNMDTLRTNIVFVRSGSLNVDQMKSSRVVGPGDIILISNWTPFLISAEEQFEAHVLTVPSWWAFQKIAPDRQVQANFHLPSDLFCMRALHTLQSSIFEESLPALQATKAIQMLAEMLRIAFDIQLGDAKAAPSVAARTGEIMRFICQNIQSEGLSPQMAADALKCSVRTIHKACADQGTSFNKLLMDARVHAVAYLLTTSSGSISDIAYSAGFSSFSHFCRLFKLKLGQSASDYRRRYSIH